MTTEAMEVRLLLTATSDSTSIQPIDANLETTNLPSSDDWTISSEDVWLDDSSADFDSAFSDVDVDTSTLYAEPDYESFLQNSPLASSIDSATDPLPEQIAEYEAMMQAAQQQADSAADIEALSEPSSFPDSDLHDYEFHDDGVQQETMAVAEGTDSGTLAGYVDEFLNSTSDADGMSFEEASFPEQTSENLSPDSTSTSHDSSTTPSNSTADSGTSDPGFNWDPMQAPEGVTFDDSHFVGYSFLDDPFSVTPTGTESFEDQQTSVTQLAPEATDSEPGSGERQRQLTTTINTKQDYVSDDEWTVTYTLINQYDDQEQSADSDDSQTETGRNYQTILTITVTNGTRVTTSWTVSDSFQFGAGTIPGEEDNDDPWAIPESWLDDAQRSVNEDTDSAADSSADEPNPTGFGVNSEDSTSGATQATAASSVPETSSSSSSGSSDTGGSDASSSDANGSGVFFTAGYSKSITNTVEKVTLANNIAATRTTNSYSWSSFFSLRIGGSYDSSQASSTITNDSSTDDSDENADLSPVTYGSTDPADTAAENAEPETTTSDATASDGGTENTVPSPYSDFKPVAKGSFKAFATGSMAASFSTTRTVPDSLSDFFSGSASTSAAFAISALAGYNSSSSLKGDLDQSSGSESDNTDEHLKIHVDNSSDSAASAGFSFWVGVSIGSNAATTGDPTDSTTTNTTTSTVDGQTIITTTDADGNVTTTDADGNPVDPVPNQPELPPDPDANSSASAPKPGRQSASDLIADNPTGIQLAVSTSYSSNVDHDFSFSEKARAVDGYLLHSFSNKNKTTFDGHLTVALGTEETNFEFGNANTSSTNVQAVYDNYVYTEDSESSYLDEPGQLSHTGQLTETYTEATTYAEDFQFALAAEDPVTHTVSLTERFESTSRDLWAGRVFLATELYFNTTDADSEEAPIYRYVESTTGVDGTNIHTFIEETPPYPIGWVDADGNPVNPDEENSGTQPPDASDFTTYGPDDGAAPNSTDDTPPVNTPSPEQILDEYQARATNIARWQAQLDQTTDPAMRAVFQNMIASEQNILADLTAAALAAGITQDQLNQAGSNAQAAAANDPIDLQEYDPEWVIDDMIAGGFTGVGHGLAMLVNAATFHQIDSLDSYVDNLVEQNSGAYGTANIFAHIGAYAAEAAVVIVVYQGLNALAMYSFGVQGYSVSGHAAFQAFNRGITYRMVHQAIGNSAMAQAAIYRGALQVVFNGANGVSVPASISGPFAGVIRTVFHSADRAVSFWPSL